MYLEFFGRGNLLVLFMLSSCFEIIFGDVVKCSGWWVPVSFWLTTYVSAEEVWMPLEVICSISHLSHNIFLICCSSSALFIAFFWPERPCRTTSMNCFRCLVLCKRTFFGRSLPSSLWIRTKMWFPILNQVERRSNREIIAVNLILTL